MEIIAQQKMKKQLIITQQDSIRVQLDLVK